MRCGLCLILASKPDNGWTWSRPTRCSRCGERMIKKVGRSFKCMRCKKHWHAVQWSRTEIPVTPSEIGE